MRLKHGAFRHLRMAAKGSAFGIRRLLEKAGENFWIGAALGTRHLLKPVDENFGMGRRRRRGQSRQPLKDIQPRWP